jgi:UPF0755 protein
MSAGWDEPFGDDDDARERARRRAEREARRAEREESQPEPQEEPNPGSRQPSSGRRQVVIRRLVVLIGLLAGLALLVVGIVLAADQLSTGDEAPPAPPPPKPNEVTIAEGHDRAEVAALLRDTSIKGDYAKATKSFKGFDPAKYGAPKGASLEGFLFPDTYQLPKHATVDDLIERQLDAFKQNLSQVDMGYARSKNLTPYDVLIIASMVEEEAAVPGDRGKIAAVIYNRLHAGMQLGIDATIRYITGNHTKPLSPEELAIDSPYNTRTHTGLPPGPIDSPGLASIQAAAHPAKVDYLYFVVKPCTDPPQHFFTASASEFEAAVARYNQARDAAGGRAPTQC